MAAGWAGGSSVCHATQLEAARSFCAVSSACQQPLQANGSPTPTGAQAWDFQFKFPADPIPTTVEMYLQPCERLDPSTWTPILGAAILLCVSIVCAKAILHQFRTHH